MSLNALAASSSPYGRIIIKKRPPNQFVENVKAGLATNLIWLIAGVLITMVSGWLLDKYGVDINPFDR